MILVLGLVSAIQTGLIGGFAWQYLSRSLDDQIGQRALMVAKTVAAMPSVIEGIERRDT
ncbi:sensor histidine kinase, partial [bacterium]|nr:sensor histidine kinase [bacterium]